MLFLGTLLDMMRSRRLRWLKKKAAQTKKKNKNSKERISLLWLAVAVSGPEQDVTGPDYAEWSVEYWLNSTFSLNPLLVVLFTTGWFWIFKKISNGALSLLSVVVLSEAALFMCTLFTVLVFPNNDNSYELQNILYLLNLLAVEVVVAITIVIRVVSLRLNLDYSNLVLLTSSIYDAVTQILSVVTDLVLNIWDYFSNVRTPSHLGKGWKNFQLTFAPQNSCLEYNPYGVVDLLQSAFIRRFNLSLEKIQDLYTYWVAQNRQLKCRHIVFSRTAEISYVDTTTLLDLKQPTNKLPPKEIQRVVGPWRNNTLTRVLGWNRFESINAWSNEIYGGSFHAKPNSLSQTSKIFSYVRSLYRHESAGLEFKNPHETMRILELLESRIISHEVSSVANNPNYFGLFSDEIGQYWQKHDSYTGSGLGKITLRDKIHYLDAESYNKAQRQDMLESLLASNFSGKYLGRRWLTDYQISQLSPDDGLNLNNSTGVRKRLYSASWRPRHAQLSDRGAVSVGRSRHLEQIQDLEGVYARTLRWLENGQYAREFWEPSFRKIKGKAKLSREFKINRLAINAKYSKKMYKLRGSAWNNQIGSRQRYWGKTRRPRRYLLDAIHDDRWSLNFIDSLSRWKVDSQSARLSDIKRPKARLHNQKGRFPQRKRFSSRLVQQTLESTTSPEVGYSLVKRKLRTRSHQSSHRRLERRRYWSKIVHKIFKNPLVWAWASHAKDFIAKGARHKSRRRKKYVTWHIDPDHIEIVPYDPQDTVYTQQKLLKPSWYNFVHWAYELKVNRYHVAPIFRLIRDRNLELPLFDRYFRKVDKILGLHGATHHMYRAENRDIRSFWRNKKLDTKQKHDIGTFVEEVIWPERYVQHFVRYRKRKRKKSKITSGLNFTDTRPLMHRLKKWTVNNTKKYVRPKYMRRATPGVHFNKLKPYVWWNRSGVNERSGLELRNGLYGLGTGESYPILITTPQNSTVMEWFRWKTWEVVNLCEYLMVKLSPLFTLRGYITNKTNRPEIMFNIVTYLNDVGWAGAFKEYGWEFLLRYMLFSKYTVDFFLFYFYVIYEALLQIPGLEGGFLTYSELFFKYSIMPYIWSTYLRYWLDVPKMLYELPQRASAGVISSTYASPVKFANSLSSGFFLLRKYPLYLSLEKNMVFFIRQVLLNLTPSPVFYPIVDTRFWWVSLGGSNSFGLYRLKNCIHGWCVSWFKAEPLLTKHSSTVRKTVLGRAETFGREKFSNLVAYPRKNRRRWRRSKKVRSFSSKTKRSITWRNLKQSLVNVAMERNGRVGYDDYADSYRYRRRNNKRITKRGMAQVPYASNTPQTLIFKENSYSPELVPEVSSLLLVTLAKQKRQTRLVLPNMEEVDSKYYLLNQNTSADFVDFLDHTKPQWFETKPRSLRDFRPEKTSGAFYKEYLRAKIKKYSYAAADLTVRDDVADLLQKIKIDRPDSGKINNAHTLNTTNFLKTDESVNFQNWYSPEANLPAGGRWEFFNLVGQDKIPKIVTLKQPEKTLTLNTKQNPYNELFSQRNLWRTWNGKSLQVKYSYNSANSEVWSLNNWTVENRAVLVNIKTNKPQPRQHLFEVYEIFQKCWRMLKKTDKKSVFGRAGLLENASSGIGGEWGRYEMAYTQKPPSAEPWGSRGSGPILNLDRGSLPWDEDFDEDAEIYDYSSVPLTSRELREEELLREPNSYALAGVNDLLTGTDPRAKVKLDGLRYRKLKARYRKDMPIRKTLGRPRPVSFLRIRARKHRTKELGVTQPRIDTFRHKKNKKKLSFFEKMSSDLGRTVAHKEIFTSTWKQRGGYWLSNLPSISPRSKFKYKADGLRDFGMSTYLTPYTAPYLTYRPYNPSRQGRSGLNSVTVLNNRPHLNEELELDEDRDEEESVKVSATALVYKAQELKNTDQSWMLAPKRSQIAKKLKILTRKKGDVLSPDTGTFAQTGISFFAKLPTNRQRVFQLRELKDPESGIYHNTKTRFSFRKSINKLDTQLLLSPLRPKSPNSSKTKEKLKKSYLEQIPLKVSVGAKSGVGTDSDGYTMSKMEGMEGKKNLLGRALARKLFSTFATTDLHNYGSTNAEPDLVKMRKKQRRMIGRRLRVRYASLWRPKKLKTKRKEPYENQKRLRAEQHIHFPYRKKKFWSQNEPEYTTNKIVNLNVDPEKKTLSRMGGHFLKTFSLGQKKRPVYRIKLKDYYGVRTSRANRHPAIGSETEESVAPRRRRRRKARKSVKKRRFPRRFFLSRNLIKRETQTASDIYYKAHKSKVFAPINLRTWYLDKRPGQKLQKWAKKFGYKKNIRRVPANSFFAAITFYKRHTKMHTGLNNPMREFKKNVLYANSLVVPLGSKKSGNSFKDSLDVLRASSYARRAEREYGNSESLSEPFIRYFRSSSALEESLFFKNKKQEHRKYNKIRELSSTGKLNSGDVINLLFSSKDPYPKSWIKPMSQSRSLDDLAPATLTSSRNLANLRNFAVYEESDLNWTTFQNIDLVEEDPDWPRFDQSYKKVRQRNSIFTVNDSGFFTYQDSRLDSKLTRGKPMVQKPLLKLIANYVYGEYGPPRDKVKKRLTENFEQSADLNREIFNGGVVVRTGVFGGGAVTPADYVTTTSTARLKLIKSKGNWENCVNQKNITFSRAQTSCELFDSDNATKLWAKKLAEQSLRAVFNAYPEAAEEYTYLIEQAKRGDFSELTVPQEGLIAKFGSKALSNVLVPIFVRMSEEKTWSDWLFGEKSSSRLALLWIRVEDINKVFNNTTPGGKIPQVRTNLIETLVSDAQNLSPGVIKSHKGDEVRLARHESIKGLRTSEGRNPQPEIDQFQLAALELLNRHIEAFSNELWFMRGGSKILFRTCFSLYRELNWLIFPRTSAQSQDKTPTLWWLQQAYWNLSPLINLQSDLESVIVTVPNAILQLQSSSIKKFQPTLALSKIPFRLVVEFLADVRRMFFVAEGGWNITTGLLKYINSTGPHEGVRIFQWTYFVAVPYGSSFILLSPLKIKCQF